MPRLLYDQNGSPLSSIETCGLAEFSAKEGKNPAIGDYPYEAYIKLGNDLIKINGIHFEFYYDIINQKWEIHKDGKTIMLINSDKMDVNKLITDIELKSAINELTSHE